MFSPSTFLQARIRTLSWFLVCALLTVATARAASIPGDVRRAVADGEPVWVFLRDKGPESGLTEAVNSLRISRRARARIRKRGGVDDPVLDAPVFPQYRQEVENAGMVIRSASRWFNAVAGTILPARLESLARLDCVQSLRPVAVFKRAVRISIAPFPSAPRPGGTERPLAFDYGPSAGQIEAIGVDRLHTAGLDGTGVLIGFLDTGFDVDAEVFDSLKVIATHDFINGDEDVGDNDAVQMSHGTATLSACAGFLPGQLIGVAPRAEYALAKTEIVREEIQVEEDFWVAGLEWADSLGCDIVSSSLGYTKWYTYADLDGNTGITTRAADLAAQRGLLVVTAAGNEGNKLWRYIIIPADGDSVLAVGASIMAGDRASFSSVGPTADGRIKPDVLAPGVGVWTANPQNGGFSAKNGTSFSTPLVAGVCALMLQHNPLLTPIAVIERLRETADHAASPDTLVGWGVVRAAVAVNVFGGLRVTRIEAWPNPTADSVRIVTPDSNAVGVSRFQVFTAAGQPVFRGEFPGNVGVWPGVTADGRRVASGIYLIRVETPARKEIVKVAVKHRD